MPPRTKTAQRKRRLYKGLQYWDFDRVNSPEPTRRIAVLTLTIAGDDLLLAAGRVRDFWRRARQRWIGLRYFCWLEVQRRGQVHYQGVWLNPPSRARADLLEWVHKSWGLGRTQVRFPTNRGAIEHEMEYARSYAKKMGKKAYQQIYDNVPRELRTFMSQRLEIPKTEIRQHIPKNIYVYRKGRSSSYGLWRGVATIWREHLELVNKQDHIGPPERYCTAKDHSRKPRSPPRNIPLDPPKPRGQLLR